MEMTFHTILCLLLIAVGLAMTFYQIQSNIQTYLSHIRKQVIEYGHQVVLDDLCQRSINFFNDFILCGGIGGAFSTWIIYTLPIFSPEDRLKLIHSFALWEEQESKVKDIVFSPGGVMRFLKLEDKDEEIEVDVDIDVEGDMEWNDDDSSYGSADETSSQEEEKLSTFLERNNVKTDLTTTTQTEQSTNSSIQVTHMSEEIHHKHDIHPTSPAYTNSDTVKEENKGSLDQINIYTSTPSPEQALKHFISQKIQKYFLSTCTKSFSEYQLSTYIKPKHVQQISIISSLIFCTQMCSSRRARKAFILASYALSLITCLSVSASSTFLYYMLKSEKESNNDYKRMLAVYLLTFIGNTKEQTPFQVVDQEESLPVASKNHLIQILSSFQNYFLPAFIGNSSWNDRNHLTKSQKKWNSLIRVASFIAVVHFSRIIRRTRRNLHASI